MSIKGAKDMIIRNYIHDKNMVLMKRLTYLSLTMFINMNSFTHMNISEIIFVYRMGRLCEGAHEISGIKAPLFLCWWVVGWGWSWGRWGWGGCVGGGVCGVLVRDEGGGQRVGSV